MANKHIPPSTRNIRRIDSRKGHGYQVHIERDGQVITKHFADSHYPSPAQARKAAMAYRDEVLAQAPPPRNRLGYRTVAHSNTGEVGISLVETKNGLEADRFEKALSLRFLERIGIDELTVDPSSVLAKRSGGELYDGQWRVMIDKQAAKPSPGRRANMMGFINEQRRRPIGHSFLDLSLGASGDLHSCDHDIRAVK